ncbi:MAG: ATP-binding cassette domain-containing protein, partial [Firmicutes bacterium]|nr:ATP-binding cassette domain-containing protein [Bacillota bacterium]
MGALISVENVVFEYVGSQGQQVRALDSVSLEVGQGEFVAIIGHNGSGKSTLAKHLNGLLVPVSGRVIVGGKCTSNPDDIWSIRQTVGMVFQNPDNQLVATTVEDDVAFGPENLGVPPDEIAERVRAALSAVGLEGLELRSPGRLSGGQKQRVAIAGVLSMKPECIVLDEPTAMLDPIGRREVLDTVRRLSQQEGKAVVLVTHFMEEAA